MPTTPKPNRKIADEGLAKLCGAPGHARLGEDPRNGTVLFLDVHRELHWFDGFALTPPPARATCVPYKSFHYPGELHVHLKDVARFLRGTTGVSERAMFWWLGQGPGSHLYRELIRFGDRVLLVWGRNNARNLQSVGLTFRAEAEAASFVKQTSTVPPSGFRPMWPFYVQGRGGVSREYDPPRAEAKKGYIRVVAQVLGKVSRIQRQDRKGSYETQERVHTSPKAASKAFDAWEFALLYEGGRHSEVEWMKELQPGRARRA